MTKHLEKLRYELGKEYGKLFTVRDPCESEYLHKLLCESTAKKFTDGFTVCADQLLPLIEECRKALELVNEISNSDAFKSVFTMSQIHGMAHQGKQSGDQVRQALSKLKETIGE